MATHLGQVPGPRRGDRVVGRGREPVQPDQPERPGSGTAAASYGGGAHVAARGLCLGEDRSHRLDDLGHDLGRECLRFAAGHHPQSEQVRLASCLMILYLVGGSHGR